MEVLNEYINHVPVTNLWHLWAGVVGGIAITVWLIKRESAFGVVAAVLTVFLGITALYITTAQTAYLERVGYINDPPAFVEMLDDWELIEQKDQLMVLRRMEPMTDDEVKEWKNHE